MAAEFNPGIVNVMVNAAKIELTKSNAVVVKLVHVPGSYEIPIVADLLLQKGAIDALLAIGFIERGETMHGEVMGHVVHRKIIDLQIQYGCPIGIGIIGPGATGEQAEVRKSDYGIGAARAAVKMCEVVRELSG